MPEHTEAERRKKLPLLARLGRNIGESTARSRVRREELNAASAANRKRSREQFGAAVESVKTAGREFSEGFSSGNQGRAVDTSAFNPGEGTLDKTPRPTGSGAGPDGTPLAPGDPEFEFAQQSQVVRHADRASDPFTPDENIPAPSLANIGREAHEAGGGSKVDRPPTANASGQFEGGVPEGFINVIRGTRSTFQRVDDQGRVGQSEFSAVPGQSLAQAEQVGARRDPAFNVLQQEDLERGRVNAATVTAEAQRLNAQANNRFQGIDPETGQFGIFQMDANGVPQPTGISPIVDTIVNGTQDFTVETVSVPSEIPGVANERQIRLNKADGTFIDITEIIRSEIGAAEFMKLRQLDPDADIEDLIEQAEAAAGGALPQLRAAFSEQ